MEAMETGPAPSGLTVAGTEPVWPAPGAFAAVPAAVPAPARAANATAPAVTAATAATAATSQRARPGTRRRNQLSQPSAPRRRRAGLVVGPGSGAFAAVSATMPSGSV